MIQEEAQPETEVAETPEVPAEEEPKGEEGAE